jgi:hypothetical protein
MKKTKALFLLFLILILGLQINSYYKNKNEAAPIKISKKCEEKNRELSENIINVYNFIITEKLYLDFNLLEKDMTSSAKNLININRYSVGGQSLIKELKTTGCPELVLGFSQTSDEFDAYSNSSEKLISDLQISY